MRFEQVYNGEWVAVPPTRRLVIACCDCGLVHRIDVRVRRGQVHYRPYRDRPATRAQRRVKRYRMRRR